MNDQIEPADAARALREIGRQREQVIRRSAIPGWYWWAVGVLNMVLVADIELQRGALFWTGIALYTAGLLAVDWLKSRAVGRAPQPRDDLASVPRVLAATAAFVAVVIGVALAAKLSLEAAGVPYPGLIAGAVASLVVVAGGQMLMRYRTAVLLRRPGGRG